MYLYFNILVFHTLAPFSTYFNQESFNLLFFF